MEQETEPAEDRLSNFIRANLEAILGAWEDFASSISAARHLDPAGMRDHAKGMLLAIADDLDSQETAQEQQEKSWGRAPRPALESEAERHGAARVASGFTPDDAISEFRALRANVLQLWFAATGRSAHLAQDDTVRFNEAVDQALTESMQRYALDKDETMRRFDTLLSSSPDLQCILRPNASFLYVNRTLAQLFNHAVPDVTGRTLDDMCPAIAPALKQDLVRAIASREAQRGEVRCTAQAGPAVTYRYVMLPVVRGADVESVTVTARNISELKASEEQILRQAYYDSLTDLPNRMLFRDRLEQEVHHAGRTGRMIVLLYIDLDGFKEVNDRYGHDVGDLVLQEAARRISGKVRASDTVARLGGDEFTVILTEVSKVPYVEVLVQEILEELVQPFFIKGNQAIISGSIGVTLFPQDAQNSEDLIRNADQAMFVAKKAGRDQHAFFTPEMRESAWARLRMIDELRHALRAGQLAVFYQPIVEMDSETIVKAEALVRWQHPQSGTVLPGNFISLAEEAGLINDIDALVLDQALERARHWSTLLGRPFQVSVNRSPLEFMNRSLPGREERELAQLAAAGGQLAVEITEGVMLNDNAGVRDKLSRVQAAGVQLAIDDFGTGYSSLSYLKNFKVDFLKIDQSFVRDMMDSLESRIFVETIVLMAHRLGLKVIAEGVETRQQHDWLHNIGCDYAQGYLYAEAKDAAQFEAMLAAA